ncbi:MAG: hypothetical protein RJA81_936, partial [Planctomycetota bacterium]
RLIVPKDQAIRCLPNLGRVKDQPRGIPSIPTELDASRIHA